MTESRTRMEHHLHSYWHEFVHWLYEPALMGRKCARVRHVWLHRIHLIPGSWMTRDCDNYDRRLEMTEDELRRAGPTGR